VEEGVVRKKPATHAVQGGLLLLLLLLPLLLLASACRGISGALTFPIRIDNNNKSNKNRKESGGSSGGFIK
jgi:hypothetical protein